MSLPSACGSNELVVFAKGPVPGLVKTRLAAAIGPEAACACYRELLRITAAHVAGLAREAPGGGTGPPVAHLAGLVPETRVTVQYAPETPLAELAALFPAARFRPQRGAGLGERIADALDAAFAAGARRAAVIGTDCPEVSAARVAQAWQELAGADLVLGPALDGGYWLAGLNRPIPDLFVNIAWSTGLVLEQTLERARALGLRARLLETLRDIDTAEDWDDFCRATGRPIAPRRPETAGCPEERPGMGALPRG